MGIDLVDDVAIGIVIAVTIAVGIVVGVGVNTGICEDFDVLSSGPFISINIYNDVRGAVATLEWW